jgi:hypothetical protein
MPFGEALASKSGVCAVTGRLEGRGITHPRLPKGDAQRRVAAKRKLGTPLESPEGLGLDGARGRAPES